MFFLALIIFLVYGYLGMFAGLLRVILRPKLTGLFAQVDWSFGIGVKAGEVRQIMTDLENQVLSNGLKPEDLQNVPELFNDCRAFLEAVNQRLSLGLDTAKVPHLPQ